MFIDIKPILMGEKTNMDITLSIGRDEDERFSEIFPDITFDYPISVTGKVKNMSGYITLEVQSDVHFSSPCARCAEPTSSSVGISTVKPIATKDVSRESDEYVFPEDTIIDISAVLTEELLLWMPSKILCREDCRGLCPRCGKNLNEGDCTCAQSQGDPRLAVLKTLLK